MNKSDSKYFNTAQRMDEALINLLAKKSLDFITVKEICENAGVNRTTFYLHYETIGDLLSETMEFVNKRFLAYYDRDGGAFVERIRNGSLDELILITPDYLHPYLSFVKDNRHIFKAAFAHPEVMESKARFDSLNKHIFKPILDRFEVPPEKQKYLVDYHIHGIMAIIHNWVQNDCREDISHITEIIIYCVRPNEGAQSTAASYFGV